MASSTLRDELLAVAGVAEAEVDAVDSDAPAGVRVRLAPDADADAVGEAVQQILAAHGMRSRLADGDGAASGAGALTGRAPPSPPPPTASRAAEPATPAVEQDAAGTAMPSEAVPPAAIDEAEPAPPGTRLGSLRLDETADGVTVTATTTDGRSITQRAAPTEPGAHDAVVAAVGSLAGGSPPALVGIERGTVQGSEVITVVLERTDGSRVAGAAVVRATRAFAVAAATWAALRR